MGLDVQVARALAQMQPELAARGAGAGLMLGRQKLAVKPGRAARLVRREMRTVGLDTDIEDMRQPDGYAEGYLSGLGCPPMQVMDFSAYEGADIIHDLNAPIPPDLRDRFDFILDGGTIEHVFNTPQALDNVFHMLRPGGLFFSVNGMTGWAGHGFYQFSPELVWRYWQDARGCRVHRCIALPTAPGAAPVEVSDTGGTQGRRFRAKGMTGRWYLCYLVERGPDANPADRITNTSQGDYVHRWDKSEPSPDA